MHCRTLVWLTAILAPSLSVAQESEEVPRSQWEAVTHVGAGYDTNANGSTVGQGFLGFTPDPHLNATESPFAEAGFIVEHTANLAPQKGFISVFQLSHRINPEASFVDQSIVALGTEAVLIRGNTRFSLGVNGYASWLEGDNWDDERAGNVDIAVTHRPDTFETTLTIRTSRLSNSPVDFEPFDMDRYLAGLSFTRSDIGPRAGTVGVTFLGGRDAPRRTGSPFGNNRGGAHMSASLPLRAGLTGYLELSSLRTDYAGHFFGADRHDDQHSAAAALEFEGWPQDKWTITPQVRWVQNDSTVSLYAYDRIEAVVYVRRAL